MILRSWPRQTHCNALHCCQTQDIICCNINYLWYNVWYAIYNIWYDIYNIWCNMNYNINGGQLSRGLPGPRVSMNGISLLSQIDLMWSEFRRERGPRTAATPLERTCSRDRRKKGVCHLTSHFLGYERVVWWNLPDHWNLREGSIRDGKEELWPHNNLYAQERERCGPE